MDGVSAWTGKWWPWVLGGALLLALLLPALDPSVQLFYRDTGRVFYPFKQFIAGELRALRAPFWDPWTESGTSILGQISPGLFHPGTLLYLVFPFELAFKLNHLLALPVAWGATYLLARRMGASEAAAAVGACAYAGGGTMVALSASNLQFVLGGATVPLALHALLRFRDQPRPLRFLWAAFALALSFLGGEPQSMIVAGLIGAVWVVAEKPSGRAAAIAAGWGLAALLLAAPALLPALPRLAASSRAEGVSSRDRATFTTTPVRLLGLVIPRAFDDLQDTPAGEIAPFAEYFSGTEETAFFDSLSLGAVIVLLAIWGAAHRRAALVLCLGGAFFLLASCGPSLPIEKLLAFLIPPLRGFRYAEKYLVAGALLVSLAAALGTDAALEKAPRFAALAALLAVVLVFAAAGGHVLDGFLVSAGRTHSREAALSFVGSLRLGLAVEAGACTALALAVFFRLPWLIAVIAAVNAYACSTGLVFTMPVEVFSLKPPLAEALEARAGPSAGSWRVRSDLLVLYVTRKFDRRAARFVGAIEVLNPQVHQLAGIESVSQYTPLPDADYEAAMTRATAAFDERMGVRFEVRFAGELSREDARRQGYFQANVAALAREHPARPRAALVACARPAATRDEALLALARIDPAREAVVRRPLPLPCGDLEGARAELSRPAPGQLDLEVESPATALLAVAEHFDPGWRATLDGAPAEILQVDLAALGVAVPAGKHQIRLRYAPPLLGAGIALAFLMALGCGAAEAVRRRRR